MSSGLLIGRSSRCFKTTLQRVFVPANLNTGYRVRYLDMERRLCTLNCANLQMFA